MRKNARSPLRGTADLARNWNRAPGARKSHRECDRSVTQSRWMAEAPIGAARARDIVTLAHTLTALPVRRSTHPDGTRSSRRAGRRARPSRRPGVGEDSGQRTPARPPGDGEAQGRRWRSSHAVPAMKHAPPNRVCGDGGPEVRDRDRDLDGADERHHAERKPEPRLAGSGVGVGLRWQWGAIGMHGYSVRWRRARQLYRIAPTTPAQAISSPSVASTPCIGRARWSGDWCSAGGRKLP
jgi:hypothetical protein